MRREAAFQRLRRDPHGSAGIEFALILPIMIMLFLASITLFDLYRTYWRQVHGTHVIAELMSRETVVDQAYLNRIYDIYGGLLDVGATVRAMRITSVENKSGTLKAAWSSSHGDQKLLGTQNLAQLNLPAFGANDTIILIETVGGHPAFSTYLGFGSVTFAENAASRPRFVAAIAKN